MKPEVWVPALVFLAIALPTVLLLQHLDLAGDYRLWIAIAAGGIATAATQSHLRKREQRQRLEQDNQA